MKYRLLALVVLLLTSVDLFAEPYAGRYQGEIAQEKVVLTLSQFDNKVFGELLGQARLRLLLKGEIDSSNLLLATLLNPFTAQTIAVRISFLPDDKLSFAEITVNSVTKEATPDKEYILERKPDENADAKNQNTHWTRDTALVGNWVSRTMDTPGVSATRREKVEFRGDGDMLITEGIVNTAGISTELPGSRVLRLGWRTEEDILYVSPDGTKTWIVYGGYKVDVNRLVLLHAENNSKQTFVRE